MPGLEPCLCAAPALALSFSLVLMKHLSSLPLTKEPDGPSRVNDARAFEGQMSLVFPLCLDKDSAARLVNTNRARARGQRRGQGGPTARSHGNPHTPSW